MTPTRLLLAALLAIGNLALAATPDPIPAAPASVSADTPIYIVTSRAAFAGISAITPESHAVRSRAGTDLVLARSDAHGVDALARYVHQQQGHCGGFFAFGSRAEAEDFLANDRSAEAIARPMAGSYTIDNQATVNPWLPQVQASNIYTTIASLSAFQNRLYTTTHGRAAALWIRDSWQALANGHAGVTVSLYEGCGYCSTQPSVILKIAGSDLASEVVVVGAHLDSINWDVPRAENQRAPGADDDASGVATVTEIIRIALASGWKPRRTIEFHAYAAEELGLYGSESIADHYAATAVDVVGMLQLDMTNYKTNAPYDMQIISDQSNTALLSYFKQLFDTYLAPLGLSRRDIACGYGCSDHASWTANGFPAGMVFEAGHATQGGMGDFPEIHTDADTLANMGDTAQYSVPFAKFGLAFIGELGKTHLTQTVAMFRNGFENSRIGPAADADRQ